LWRAWKHEDKEREKHSRKNHSLFFLLLNNNNLKSAEPKWLEVGKTLLKTYLLIYLALHLG
jgi:hypothetical protein